MSIDAGAIRQEKAFSLGQVPAWLWLGIGVYAVLLVCGERLLNDSDTYWQISIGQWIIDHGALPRADSGQARQLRDEVLDGRREHVRIVP